MLRTLLPLAATLPLAAVDLLDVCDLRVNAGWAGGDATIAIAAPAPVRTPFEGWRGGADLAVGVDLLFLGVVGGAGVVGDRRSGGGWERETASGRVFAGPYLAVGPVNLEITGNLARGRGRTTAPGGGEADAPVREWGADATLTVALGPLRLGAQGGWLDSRSDSAGDWRGSAAVHAQGWHTAAIAGWRF